MALNQSARRVSQRASYVFLCASPFVAIATVAPIPGLRTSVLHQVIGIVDFATIAIAIWMLAGRAFVAQAPETRLAAIAGMLLVLPFALIGLLWVGLGPPWEASPADNQMRYVVLITAAAAVVGGCVALKETLIIAGERFFSTLGFAGMILAGPLYLVGEIILLAAFSAVVRTGEAPPVFRSLSEMQDILLFFAGVLTYASAAAFAVSLRNVGWLGRGASHAFVGLSLIALICLLMRGLQFPDPAALTAPWYMIPGLIVGIPAVPFIIPCLLGVASLRRVSRE